MFVHLVADYGHNDLAFAEVTNRLKECMPELEVHPIAVPAFSTIATGFVINQLSLFPTKGMGIYSNTAPRKDELSARVRNAGEAFIYARLTNGIPVMAVNSGLTFSFIKDRIESLHEVVVENEGSQFRSRDKFPAAVTSILRGETSHIGKALDPSQIPDLPDNMIAWIDGYGNIKTTLRLSKVNYAPGDPVKVVINTTTRKATFASGTFEVHDGELAFAPGSSGGDDPFMELFLRGSSAQKSFNKARVGQEIEHSPYNGE